ncbi:hypothetical protein BSKO_10620 [Bryopsis sp. KO-2023]|nr:hypothetical protein BSKO_10620 [Bryopsis sp. KO-2023]
MALGRLGLTRILSSLRNFRPDGKIASDGFRVERVGSVAARFGTCPVENNDDGGEAEEKRKILNKLIYRARQRGLLEMDLLLGEWAQEALPKMDMPTLNEFSVVLDEESMSLYKWLTGQSPTPEHILKNQAFVSLQKAVLARIKQNAPEGTRANPGVPWLRGWEDRGNQ